MAKGDICRIEGCQKIVSAQSKKICSMHNNRMSKYKSYELPPSNLPDGIVKICKIHGELTNSQIYRRNNIAKRPSIGKVYTYPVTVCRMCRDQRTKDFKLKHKERYIAPNLSEEQKTSKRDRFIKRKFGIDYQQKLKEQNNVCAICKKEETSRHYKYKSIRRLSVDHCHKTGKTRALLCYRCNIVLGHAEDSIELFQEYINYINSFK